MTAPDGGAERVDAQRDPDLSDPGLHPAICFVVAAMGCDRANALAER
jgi:hypothetical protein